MKLVAVSKLNQEEDCAEGGVGATSAELVAVPKLNQEAGWAGTGAAMLAMGSSISLENSTDFF